MLRIDDIVLGRYKIAEPLSEGGQYIVAKAHDQQTGQPVVVKELIVPKGKPQQKLALARLKRESQVRVQHPRVVDIIHAEEEGGRWYLVAPFVEGPDLEQHVLASGGRLCADVAADITYQIADGLAAVHTKGFVHRDIKPTNIIIHSTKGAHIIDFGICHQNNEQTLTGGNGTLGTLGWMAPEQIAAPTTVDGRADLFALGSILYFMLTGHHAVQGDTDEARARNTRVVTPAPPQQIDPSIPAHLSQACMRLLEKDPGQRIQTASELLLALNGQIATSGSFCAGCGQPFIASPRFCTRCGAPTSVPDPSDLLKCLACGSAVTQEPMCVGCSRVFGPQDHRLSFIQGPAAGTTFRIPQGIYTVGRAQLCPRNQHISSRQFNLARLNGAIQVEHGGGVNATLVRGQPANAATLLTVGDEVSFAGNVAMYIMNVGAPKP